MRKLLIVYNLKSSHHAEIEQEVLEPARKMSGWMVGKYNIKPTGFASNVNHIAKMLSDGDLLIVAGGDGTASIAINGALRSGKDITLGVIGYGNLNDIANMLGTKRTKTSQDDFVRLMARFEVNQTNMLYPLEILTDGEVWRYAPCYATIGLLAQATTIMDNPKVREKLSTGKKSTWFSWWSAVKWYLKNKRNVSLPAGKLNNETLPNKATDYLAVNGPTLARIMKGGDWWRYPDKFGSTVRRLGGFWKMVHFGLRSITSGVDLTETTRDILEFDQPSAVEIQVEGEYERLENISKIEIQKSQKKLKVIMGKDNSK